MHRELVFRAWSPSQQRMSAAFDLYDWAQWNEGAIESSIDEIRDPMFLQYAGLIDKFDRPIFEGDILRMNYWRRNEIDQLYATVIIVQITCQGGAFWFAGDGFTDCNWHYYNASDREIIGTIHQNPELLQN